MYNFNNKKVLVTGASGGIGKAISKSFVDLGAQVAISGSNEDKLRSLSSELGSEVHVFACNLADNQETYGLIDKVVAQIGGLDIVICNAGVTKDNLLLRMKIEDFSEVLNINLMSAFIIFKRAAEVMIKARQGGSMIGISSVVASMGNAGQSNYAASKSGLEGMIRSIAKEVAGRSITANCIAPGFIDTKMTEKLNQDQRDKIMNNIPLGRMGTPEEIASLATFLASDKAKYITGETIHINGGMYMC